MDGPRGIGGGQAPPAPPFLGQSKIKKIYSWEEPKEGHSTLPKSPPPVGGARGGYPIHTPSRRLKPRNFGAPPLYKIQKNATVYVFH